MSRLSGASKIEHFGVKKLSGICPEYENLRKYQCEGLMLIGFWMPTKAALSLFFSAGQLKLAKLDMAEASGSFFQKSPHYQITQTQSIPHLASVNQIFKN